MAAKSIWERYSSRWKLAIKRQAQYDDQGCELTDSEGEHGQNQDSS